MTMAELFEKLIHTRIDKINLQQLEEMHDGDYPTSKSISITVGRMDHNHQVEICLYNYPLANKEATKLSLPFCESNIVEENPERL